MGPMCASAPVLRLPAATSRGPCAAAPALWGSAVASARRVGAGSALRVQAGPAPLSQRREAGRSHGGSTRRRAGLSRAEGETQEGEETAEAAAAAELSKIASSMGQRRAVDQSQRLMESPYAPVESAMVSPVVTTTPDTLVGSILEQFEHYTGLPVVDERGRCVGILSSIDVFRQQRGASGSIATTRVRDIMTSPAVAIVLHAPIAYAAGLMLKHKVHRLPVVDSDNVVVGILTRTDIYEPLMPSVNPMLHRLVGHSPDDTPNF